MNNFPTKRQKVPIRKVKPNTWNPNKQSDFMFDKAKKSIEKNGMIDPVLVRETPGEEYEIIDGEHRWRACKELGFTEIIIENAGEIDIKTAKLLTLLMNNIKGEDDVLKRAEILKQLNNGQRSLFPATEKEIKEILDLLDFDFEQFKDVEFAEEEKDPFIQGCAELTRAQMWFNKIYEHTRDKRMRILIEQFRKMVKEFRCKI